MNRLSLNRSLDFNHCVHFAMISALFFLGTSCGSSSHSNNSPKKTENFPITEAAQYKTACEFSSDTNESNTTILDVQAPSISLTARVFSSPDCSGEAVLTTILNASITAFSSETEAGFTLVDLQFGKATLLANSQKWVDFFNSQKWCGFSDWVLGVSKEVNGLACSEAKIPKLDSKIEALFKFNSTSVQFSLPEDEPYSRPTTLDPEIYERLRK